MDMIGHQHVGVDLATFRQRRLSELTRIAPVILLAKEARLAIVAPLNDVLRKTRQIQTSLTRHNGLLPSSEKPQIHR